MAEVLKYDSVSIEYDGKKVLEGFDLSIEEGEFISLIGPNGSGKSTLINAFLGLVPLASGAIYLMGSDNSMINAKSRAQVAAVVPQTFSTPFSFSVHDIVMMGRNPFMKRFASHTEDDLRIVDDALEQTGTLELRERKITTLSGGERQRVVIAAALAQSPRILILDEPTNHLDLNHSLQIMQLAKWLNVSKGITVLAVLHDINAAARFSDRICVLHGGKIAAAGKVSDVVSEDILGDVYDIDLIVRNNRITDSLEIVPLRNRQREKKLANKRVHVVCGGGSGEMFLEELRSNGYIISCGVLNESDSDAVCCNSLGIEFIEERPYSPISEGKKEDNLALMKSCEAIVLTDVPFGTGNMANLSSIWQICEESDLPVYIVAAEGRDFVGGAADDIIDKLINLKGAMSCSRQELLALIKSGRI